ncbi:hypothetical protein Tco_0911012 [Tanacetum coccineum]|uniref:Reverse transcriptase domain-containing protein n=1 Tax=Tanacetum coccineum TaxID=301880 RepID=A0ABQ5CX69_9ASTR
MLKGQREHKEIAITTVNVECSAIIMNKVPEKLEDPGKFLIHGVLYKNFNNTNALADSHSDEPVLLNTPLTDKVECFAPEDDIDEIDAFLAMEVSSNFEEGYFDSEGDVIFLENLLSDDTTHNLTPEVISDHDRRNK